VKPGKKYQTKRAVLLLADGTRFEGDGLGPDATALGEAVFYTGMTGYEEALTDPSYAGQILTFTYPLIGNYGVSRSVSQHPHATTAGCVMKHLARRPSHFENVVDLGTWLEEQAVPTIVGVDTRALTIALREHGTIGAALAVGDKSIAAVDATLAEYVRTMTTAGLVESVSDAYHVGETIGHGSTHVVLLD
jgi:carbamoyl-phosphate synthase small subunit